MAQASSLSPDRRYYTTGRFCLYIFFYSINSSRSNTESCVSHAGRGAITALGDENIWWDFFQQWWTLLGSPRHRALLQYILLSASFHPTLNELATSMMWKTWFMSILHIKVTGGMTVLIILFTVIEESKLVFSLNSGFLCVFLVTALIPNGRQICA